MRLKFLHEDYPRTTHYGPWYAEIKSLWEPKEIPGAEDEDIFEEEDDGPWEITIYRGDRVWASGIMKPAEQESSDVPGQFYPGIQLEITADYAPDYLSREQVAKELEEIYFKYSESMDQGKFEISDE
jgi:hypothetical protein